MAEEPRHRVVHATEALRVMDIQIQPGDTTLFHTHATPVAYIVVGRSSSDQQRLGGAWAGTRPPAGMLGPVGTVLVAEGYLERPLTHRVTNVGSRLFRLVAVSSRRTRRADTESPTATLPGEVGGSSPWFAWSELDVAAGAGIPVRAERPTVVVLPGAGRVAIERADGWVTSLESPGATAVLAPGTTSILRGGRDRPATVVLVEVR